MSTKRARMIAMCHDKGVSWIDLNKITGISLWETQEGQQLYYTIDVYLPYGSIFLWYKSAFGRYTAIQILLKKQK